MILTDDEIKLRVYNAIMSSNIPDEISGGVYYGGDRPHDSSLEDITIEFTTGDTAQIQEGVVTVLAYVPDIADKDGTFIQNRRRTMELGRKLTDWGSSLGAKAMAGFLWRVKGTPQVYADMEYTHQHFISLKLSYKTLQ